VTVEATDLAVLVEEIVELHRELSAEISQPTRRDVETHARSAVSASPAPWNDEAAGWVLTVEAGARDHEQMLTRIAFNGPSIRATTTAGSLLALRHLPWLIGHVQDAHPARKAARHAANDLAAWARQGRILLDQAKPGDEPWTNAPGSLTCPHCDKPLYLPPGALNQTRPSIYCVSCRDDNGRRIEFDNLTWLGVLNQRDTPNDAA